ncbi:MAG: radical SAM protein [Chloroflexi bacterium]|nr:radical SAM protein [Chloroflexota bacterium]
MARVQYVEVQCKSALNRVQGMPFKWSLNPYVGCVHACVYCYARAYYATAEHGNPGHDFETRILVKTNIAAVLRRQLGRPSWHGEQVALGTATDAYQPAEGRFRLTRQILEALRDYANPLGMVTKSPMVYRDLDVLADLARMAKVRIFFTITTVDLSLWRTLEPGTANPYKRLQVMRELVRAGIAAGVLLAPILPGITDSVESIEAVAQAAADHEATFFGSSSLRLTPVVREHYFDFVGETFPDLLPRYERAYASVNAPREYQTKLAARVERVRARYGFAEESMRSRRLAPATATIDDPPTLLPTHLRGRRGPQLALPLDTATVIDGAIFTRLNDR